MAELISLIFFLISAGAAARMIQRKIPLLVQVPEHLIESSFATRPSRIASAVGPVAAFFRDRKYLDLYYAGLVRVLHRLRLVFLRLERTTFRILESIQARGMRLTKAEERYWNELRQWKQDGRENGKIPPPFPPDAGSPQDAGARDSSTPE